MTEKAVRKAKNSRRLLPPAIGRVSAHKVESYVNGIENAQTSVCAGALRNTVLQMLTVAHLTNSHYTCESASYGAVIAMIIIVMMICWNLLPKFSKEDGL